MSNDKRLTRLIQDMVKVDQGLRLKAKDGQDLLNYMIYLADTSHNYRIHKIINENSYPKTSLIGSEAMKDFWLLIQHQDYDPVLQQQCLENCDFAPKEKAFLTDRVRMNGGLPQIYGTQHILVDGVRSLYETEDLKNIDERRKAVGLPPIAESTQEQTLDNLG